MPLSNAINQIGLIACADVFIDTSNKLQMIVYNKDQTDYGSAITIEKEHLLTAPIIADNLDFIVNNYSITVGQGIVVTDTTAGDASRKKYGERMLEAIDLTNRNVVATSSVATAQWIGESYISRYGEPQTILTCDIDRQVYKNYIELGMYLRFSISDWENYDDVVWQCTRLEESDDRTYSITCRRVFG